MFPIIDWRSPRSPPWISVKSGRPTVSSDPFDFMRKYQSKLNGRPKLAQMKASIGKPFHRVPSLEELDEYGAAGGGGGFKKDYEYQQSKEMDPMEYAWLVQQQFVSSIKHQKKMTPEKKKGYSMDSLSVGNLVKGSKQKNRQDMNSLRHLDLATGWQSSRHVLVEEVISNVLARAQESADFSGLRHLGLPVSYLPTIAEAIQANHLSQFRHLDLANSGSLGEKSLKLRRLVEKRLPAFLSAKILPYNY